MRTLTSTVGCITRPSRFPPISTFAPSLTASFTHASARIASFSSIIGPTSQSFSSGLPTFSFFVSSTNRFVNSFAIALWT